MRYRASVHPHVKSWIRSYLLIVDIHKIYIKTDDGVYERNSLFFFFDDYSRSISSRKWIERPNNIFLFCFLSVVDGLKGIIGRLVLIDPMISDDCYSTVL